MSLQGKVTLIVVAVFVLSGVLSFYIQHQAILPSFQLLDKETATKNAERVLEAVHRELQMIGPSVSDWANWTDTYVYAKGEKTDYADKNLNTGSTLDGMKINYIGIFDNSGTALWTQAIDLNEGNKLDLGDLTGSRLEHAHPLLQLPELTSDVNGLIDTSFGPLLVFAKPILTTDREGPSTGTIIMGRFLDERAISRLAGQTRLPVKILPADRHAPVNWVGGSENGLVHSEVRLVEGSEHWQARYTLSDVYGQPFLQLQVETPRDISSRGRVAVAASLWSLGGTGLIMMGVMLWLLHRAVLRPIAILTSHALQIGANDNLQARLDLNRQDEVGVLARTFDDMVDHLAETRRRLVDQSFHSGASEMASGVLHNIGNTLTPLKVKLSDLQCGLGAAPVAEMEQAAAELASPSTSAERRSDLKKFIQMAGMELAHLVKNSREGASEASRQLAHIQEILVDQERFSRSARVIEPVDMAAVFRDAAAGLSPQMAPAVQIEISPGVSDAGPVLGAHTALKQIATNLLVNAVESILLAGTGEGKIVVSAAPERLKDQLMVHLQIEDNGGGIAAKDRARIFTRGFSTKERDGSGHGLHWSANTVQALNGRLTVKSHGVGLGACFHLWLPSARRLTPEIASTEK